MNIEPVIEIEPNIKLKFDNFDNIRVVKRIIGTSVISGAIATLMPSFLSFFKVSETTNISRGPGVIPADNPKKNPKIKKETSIIELHRADPVF